MPLKTQQHNIEEILDFEHEIYAPILRSSGINFTKKAMRMGLEKPQVILTEYSDGILSGIFRYSINENEAFILSLAWKGEQGKNMTISFARKILRKLKEDQITTLESVVQISNHHSMRFHQKLGFNAVKNYEKAIRFRMRIEDLKIGNTPANIR
jgi:hypothetical protein